MVKVAYFLGPGTYVPAVKSNNFAEFGRFHGQFRTSG